MKLIVGLGNPGVKYQGTRHNAGFMVIDEVANYYDVQLKKEERKALVAKLRVGSDKIILAKPQTFMNNSGQVVQQLATYYNIDEKDILVIYDDLDLKPGQIKIKPKGGHGGHNGLKSIFNHLGSREISRIRVGIGRPEYASVVDYVLGKFSQEEEDNIKIALNNAKEAVKLYLEDNLQQAMNKYN